MELSSEVVEWSSGVIEWSSGEVVWPYSMIVMLSKARPNYLIPQLFVRCVVANLTKKWLLRCEYCYTETLI